MTSATPSILPSTAVRLRRRTIAVSAVGSAVTLLVSDLLDPVGEGSVNNLLAAATDHTGAMVGSSLLLVLSSILLIPTIVGILGLVIDRGAATTNVGAVLLTLGAFGHAMAATFFLIVSALPEAGLEQDAIATALAHLEDAPNLAIVFVFILTFALGLLVSFIGLWRARVVPTWVLGAIVGAFAIEFAAPGGQAVALVKQALTLVAFSYLTTVLWSDRRPASAAGVPIDRSTTSAEVGGASDMSGS